MASAQGGQMQPDPEEPREGLERKVTWVHFKQGMARESQVAERVEGAMAGTPHSKQEGRSSGSVNGAAQARQLAAASLLWPPPYFAKEPWGQAAPGGTKSPPVQARAEKCSHSQ